MDSEILWTSRTSPVKMFEKTLDGLLIVSSILAGKQLELGITEWDGDGAGFVFRVPHVTPNQANQVIVDCRRALFAIDEKWEIGYKDHPSVWEWFHVRYTE